MLLYRRPYFFGVYVLLCVCFCACVPFFVYNECKLYRVSLVVCVCALLIDNACKLILYQLGECVCAFVSCTMRVCFFSCKPLIVRVCAFFIDNACKLHRVYLVCVRVCFFHYNACKLLCKPCRVSCVLFSLTMHASLYRTSVCVCAYMCVCF